MNRTTDEVEKVRAALGSGRRRAPGAGGKRGLIVTFGGGSVTEARKLVRLCLQHDIADVDGFEPFRIVVDAHGKRTAPAYEGPRIAQIAIPTTLSAGEFMQAAVKIDSPEQVLRILEAAA